ncbi:hypothetical protein P3T73_02265 [Kiritimatiellota bacterium B12222]|nr:hypothetical protein P3T73_02265 [Kiritimatiellota bacterium B12222]
MSTQEARQNHKNLTRSERREQAAADALRALIRDTLQHKFPAYADQAIDLPLTLSLTVNGNDSGDLQFDPCLRDQICDQAAAFLQPFERFQAGRVYDFHEQRHQPPPSALSVFSGYGPMGHPQWAPIQELVAAHENLKILSGKNLKREQLEAYGKKDSSYNLLAQVVLGPLPVPSAFQEFTGSPQWALSCQIIETRNPQGQLALHLNRLVGGLLPDELDAMLQEATLRPLGNALTKLEHAIAELEDQALLAWSHQDKADLSQILKQVPILLGEFSSALHHS